ncbi:MAG: hypothetical protein WC680_08635 [Sulfuricurvum sp.]|jgi:hypothetical protein
MFDYESGILVALLFWIFYAGSILVSINSQVERNLNKIGQRLSWITLAPKLMTIDDVNHSVAFKIMKYLFVIGIAFAFIFLSWAYIIVTIVLIIYKFFKDFGAPQTIREFRWKLKNSNLTFEQLMKELMKVSEVDESKYDEFTNEVITNLQERGLR